MNLSNAIKLVANFDRSTNLDLDYKNPEKINRLFISEKIESATIEILNSVLEENSNQRVRVLSGSPGLGKSTFALFLMKLLSKEKPKVLREKIANSQGTNKKELVKLSEKFLKTRSNKLLPVFLNGDMGNLEEVFSKQLHEALEREGIEEEFDEMLQEQIDLISVVQTWKIKFKKVYKLYTATLDEHGLDLKKFESALKRGTKKAKEQFFEIYREVTGGTDLQKNTGNIVELYKSAINVLNAYGYSGIYVVYDEFGKYLEKGINQPSKLNIQFLQDFAEYCDRSGEQQCHLMLITHLSVSQYANRFPINIQKEWAKIEGRFQENSFYDRSSSYYQLITRVFDAPLKAKDLKKFKEINKFYRNFYQNFPDSDSGLEGFIDQTTAKAAFKTYPLHPVTFGFLPILSQKVAQNERTLYTFLTRNEPHSLRNFLERYTTDDAIWLMPSDLYRYFAPLIEKDCGVGGAHRIALIVNDTLKQIPSDDIIGKEIISLVGLAEVVRDFRFAPNSLNFFVDALHGIFDAKEIKSHVKKLTEEKLLFFNRFQKKYELQQGSSVDISEEIEKKRKAKLSSKQLVNIISGLREQKYFVPKRYNQQHRITRFLTKQLISVEELSAGKFRVDPDYYAEDGLIYCVVVFDQDEMALANEIISEKEDQLVVYFMPNNVIECRADIEELNAINSLYNDKELLSTGPMVKKELDRYKRLTIAAIEKVLSPLLNDNHPDFKVRYPRMKINSKAQTYVELQKVMTTVLEQEFSNSIDINSELINRHKVSAAVTLARRGVIEKMLAKPEEKLFGIEGNGPDRAVCAALRKVSGLRWSPDKEKLMIPAVSKLTPLFKAYKELISKDLKGIGYKEIANLFVSPPFGVRKSVVPLYMALFDQLIDQGINHYFNGSYVPEVDGEYYELVCKNPKLGKIQSSPDSDAHRKYLQGLAKVFGAEEATVGSVLMNILKWNQGIPEYTKWAQEQGSAGRKILIAVEKAKQPDRLIYEQVPEAFGFDPIADETSDSKISELLKGIKQTKKECQECYPNLLKRLRDSLEELVNGIANAYLDDFQIAKVDTADLASSFQYTYNCLNDQVRNHKYQRITLHFLERIKRYDVTLPKQYFIEGVADALTGQSPRNWDDKTESLFKFNLHQSEEEILNVAAVFNGDSKGEKLIAFIDRNAGESKFINLNTRSTLGNKQKAVKVKIEDNLQGLSEEEKKEILMYLLATVEEEVEYDKAV